MNNLNLKITILFFSLFLGANSFASDEVLLIQNLPIVKTSKEILSKNLPGKEISGEVKDNEELENKINQLKNELKQENDYSNYALEEARNHKNKYKDIAKSIFMISNYDKVTYAHSNLNKEDYVKIAHSYLSELDSFKIMLTQEDVDGLTKNTNQIKQALEGDDLTWIFNAFNLYQERKKEVKSFNESNLENIDFIRENYSSEWETNPDIWPKTLEERSIRLSQSMVDDYNNAYLNFKDHEKTINKIKENYADITNKTISDMEVVEIFLKNYLKYIDPHSLYFAPINKENFNMMLNNSLSGVGVVWNKKDNDIIVESIVEDGPLYKSKEIAVGDKLIKIGPSLNELEDVSSLDMNKLTERTRGQEGTTVFFVFETKDGIKTVEIKREKIRLLNNIVKSNIIDFNGNKVLVVKIPAFYRDTSNINKIGGSVSNDVKNEMEKNKNNFDLLILDLRNNGGGSLEEAVDLSSLFLEDGVVVQLRMPDRTVKNLDVVKDKKIYDGPITVIVNKSSASASEILSASLQDYGRALIVGENTYGKGTAQTLFDLDNLTNIKGDVYGQINLTTMMFYRPRGQSTQIYGVRPDIWIGNNIQYKNTPEGLLDRVLEVDDVGNENFSQPVLNLQNGYWQSNRFKIQNNSIERWKSNDWYNDWEKFNNYLNQKFKTKSLNLDERLKDFENINSIRTELNNKIKVVDLKLNDGVKNDIVLRESLLISEEAFFEFKKKKE